MSPRLAGFLRWLESWRDPHPFSRGGSWAIVTVSWMHLIQVWLLIHNPLSAGATDMTSAIRLFRLFLEEIHADWNALIAANLGVILFICAATQLAMFGALFRVGFLRLIVFIPQHIVLGAMAWGGVIAAISGAYLDGTKIPGGGAHITMDQIGWLGLFWIHFTAICRRIRDPNG